MKISTITESTNSSVKKASLPNFKGKAKFSQQMMEEVYKKTPAFPRFLMKLGQNDGEILNTIVTAIGTAAVAPIFIAYNPFSKEDKETKIYSAARQPISAVIALGVQIFVNKKFNNYMDKTASTGGFDRADLRAKPKASYLKRIIKLEHPEFNKDQINIEISKRQLIAEKNRVAELRKSLKNKKLGYEQLISSDAYDLAKKELITEAKELYKDELSSLSKKQANKFINKKVNDVAIKEKAMKNIEKEVKLEVAEKTCVRNLSKKYSTVDEAIEFIKEKQKKCKNKSGIKFTQNVLDRLEAIKLYESTQPHLKPFASVKDIGSNQKEILHNVKIKRFVRTQIANGEKVLGKYTKLLGIVVSMLTLPFSCGLLNWSYPKIMKKFMPESSDSKNNENKTTTKDSFEPKEEIKKVEVGGKS